MKKPFFIALIFLCGCFQSNTKVPSHLLDKHEMAEVMTQMHILEARIYKLYLKEDSAKKLYDHYEGLLLDSLNVPREQYEESLEFYFNEVKTFKGVYQEVVDSLLSKQKRERD